MSNQSDEPIKSDDPIETPTPCSNCNGTGKASATSTAPASATPAASYADGTCPVCGGSGAEPAPTIHADKKNSNCFVATAAFQDPHAHEVQVLRDFRNAYLLPYRPGRLFVKVYYAVGPRLGDALSTRPRLRKTVRRMLSKISRQLEIRLLGR
ncbi:CFI-box-CTERM domain-containing protein [Pelagicoccus sp. SDUM812002]|uniref:CFI-box-CTERM domain-containing protein n=1 Tax=Pelagicoccus sp. SDUM812002 TaxID=3041266 RepID=UPI00280E79AE|nr:CFI-box-CTERM domain-containing protein [Pelagicoccus sp. SDUM812002]MDQ8186210.1 hypothetical protein [Pelagicoccus sp. SDUM812002]